MMSENEASESKHRKTGINPQYKLDFAWLQLSIAVSVEAMLCALCIKHNSRPKRCVPGRAVWVDIPCQTIVGQSLSKREWSLSHKEA